METLDSACVAGFIERLPLEGRAASGDPNGVVEVARVERLPPSGIEVVGKFCRPWRGDMALSGASRMLCDGVDAVGITHNH